MANLKILTENSTLNQLDDVNAATPNDNDSLTWDTATGKWVPEPVSGGSGLSHPQVLARTMGS